MPYFQSTTIRMEPSGEGIVTLSFDVPDKSLNVLTRQVLSDLDAALDRLAADPALKLVILRGAKPSGFLAGADIKEFTQIKTPAEAEALSAAGQQLFDKLARLAVPTMAAIHGPCLGGGLELALACDYRTALDQPSTQLGLPEVELGLLPGWGGTQRLPRVVGLERALQVILNRKRLNAREAREWGLVDVVGKGKQEWLDAINLLAELALEHGKRPPGRLPLRTWRQKLLESTGIARSFLLAGARRILKRKVPDDMPAPAEAFEAVRTGLERGFEAGLERERAGAGRLAVSLASRNLVGLFLQRERARPAAAAAIQRVGVVGAGVMGAAIAQLAALKGCDVVVQEVNEAALEAGMVRLTELFDKAAARGVVTAEEAQRRRAAVRGTTAFDGFGAVDVVVEAAIEELQAKRAIFQELERRTTPGTLLATNTSSLSVAALQEGLAHPERVAGLHFFNPVHKMPLVEVVCGPATAPTAADRLAAWAATLGKTPVIVGDRPGFVVNRILMPYLAEAVLLAAQEMPVELIDRTMRRFGMPMGPLELLDQIGLDVAAHVGRSLGPVAGNRFAPGGFDPAAVFDHMAKQGWLGQKNGQGFYRYAGKSKKVNSGALRLLAGTVTADASGTLGGLAPVEAMRQARERLVLAMVNEAAAVLGEGVAGAAATIDLAMIMGTGWAPHRGGPLRYAQDRGLKEVVAALEELARHHGPRFEPCAELRQRAEVGGFYGPVELAHA